jgi:DNA-binding LacI/PurR family transcriptional regulator
MKKQRLEKTDLLLVDRMEKDLKQEIVLCQGKGTGLLPHLHALAAKYQVGLNTVRSAMDRLRNQKLIRSVRGKGTFILPARRTGREIHLIASSTNLYMMMCVSVLIKVLKDQDLKPNVVISTDPMADWEIIRGNSPDGRGIILLSAFPRTAVERLVQTCGLPVVQIADLDETYFGPAICDTVVMDIRASAYQATDYLVRQGHRRVALVGWEFEKVWNQELHRGYTQALKANGIEPVAEWVIDLEQDPGNPENPAMISPQVQTKIDRWFKEKNAPTAMVLSGSPEARIKDILHLNFRDRFSQAATISITFWEMLHLSHTGLQDTAAVVVRYEDLARRALELLRQREERHTLPVRETQARSFLCLRRNGIWQTE